MAKQFVVLQVPVISLPRGVAKAFTAKLARSGQSLSAYCAEFIEREFKAGAFRAKQSRARRDG